MNKKFFFIFILITVSLFSNEKNINDVEDKKIGIALSGGTAKGIAHIGVLKVLDEEKVPIEYVTGTSMGSIIGGLYSIGYTPKEIEEIAKKMDWLSIFNDKIDRKEKGSIRNLIEDTNSATLPLQNFIPKLPNGLVGGKEASERLNDLFYGVSNINDFKKFPKKFALVATDLETGEGVMIDKGSVATAIRSSLSLPSVFSPIRVGERLYVDGAVTRNLPVQDLKVLGADYTIGVNVGEGFIKRDENKINVIEVISDSITIAGRQEVERQIRMLDLYLSPNLKDFQSYDFMKIEGLIKAGEMIAQNNIEEIRKLSNPKKYEELEQKRLEFRKNWKSDYDIVEIEIRGNKKYKKEYFEKYFKKKSGKFTKSDMEKIVELIYQNGDFSTVYYEVENDKLVINVQEKAGDYLSFAVNVNNEDKATIKVGIQGNKVISNYNTRYSLDGIIGNEYGLNAGFSVGVGQNLKGLIIGDFSTKKNIIKNQEYSGQKFEFNNRNTKVSLGFGTEINKNTLFLVKGGYQISNIQNHLNNLENKKVKFPFYEANLIYDTRDSVNFAENGIYLNANYTLANSKNADFQSLYVQGDWNIPVTEKITVTPSVTYLTTGGKNIPVAYAPRLGGIRTSDSSLEFSGISEDKISGNSIFIGKIKLQYKFNQFLFTDASYSWATISEKSFSFGKENKESLKIGLGLKTPIGPGYLGVAKSPSESIKYILNFGYEPQ